MAIFYPVSCPSPFEAPAPGFIVTQPSMASHGIHAQNAARNSLLRMWASV